MKRLYTILPVIILMAACNTNVQAEKDYIKNLEEKNRLLEQEIENLKNGSKSMESDKPVNPNKKDYFTIGSTEKEVLEVMGNPTSYTDMGILGKTMNFGSSVVEFENGKVTGFRDYDGNLKVKLAE